MMTKGTNVAFAFNGGTMAARLAERGARGVARQAHGPDVPGEPTPRDRQQSSDRPGWRVSRGVHAGARSRFDADWPSAATACVRTWNPDAGEGPRESVRSTGRVNWVIGTMLESRMVTSPLP